MRKAIATVLSSVRVALWNAVNDGLPRDIGDHMFGKKFQYDKLAIINNCIIFALDFK